MSKLKQLKHPLIEVKLTVLRDKNTPSFQFRRTLYELASLMSYEVFKNIVLKNYAKLQRFREKVYSSSRREFLHRKVLQYNCLHQPWQRQQCFPEELQQ